MPTKWTRADSPTNEPWVIRAFSTWKHTARDTQHHCPLMYKTGEPLGHGGIDDSTTAHLTTPTPGGTIKRAATVLATPRRL